MYDTLVNAIRAQISGDIESIFSKVISVSAGPERQKVVLSNGEEISARLVVLANGLNVGLRHQLGIERRIVSACHSISLGFDLVPVGRATFDFPALTYFSERTSDRIPYLSLFPVGSRMRGNLFTYRQIDDPWLQQMRRAPAQTLKASLPRLRRITGDFEIAGDIKIRPADLYVSTGHRQPGVVLVGDAFETSCPVDRDRDRQGVHGRRTALQCPYPELACDRRHGTKQRSRRSTTIRSRQPATPGRARRPTVFVRCRSITVLLEGTALGSFRGVVL